jgi:hypothetical protein
MKYTVVGFYPSNGQTFTESIEHDDSFLAEQSIGRDNPGLTIVACFEGDPELAEQEMYVREY